MKSIKNSLLFRSIKGAALVTTMVAGMAPSANALTYDVGTASIAGLFDLEDNALVVRTTPYATIFGYIQSGYNGFGWDGATGLTSSTAAADAGNFIFTYGLIDNADPFAGFTNFFSDGSAGTAVGATASLGRLTYYGDANLDGTLDATDYFLIDNSFGGPANGWINGDFDYSGVLDSSDYFLIDGAFGSAPLASPFAGSGKSPGSSGVVPEPASLGLLVLGAVGLLGSRRRQGVKFSI